MAEGERFPLREGMLLGTTLAVASLQRLDLYGKPGLLALQFLPWSTLLVPALVLFISALRARALRRIALVSATLLLLLTYVLGVEFHPEGTARDAAFRVFSLNADMCAGTFDGMVQAVVDADADVALQVEVCGNAEYVVEKLRHHYPSVLLHGQFLLASRFPITRISPPPGPGLHLGYAAYTVATPKGPLELIAIHPVSPRPFFRRLMGTLLRPDDLPHALRFGARNAALRKDALLDAAREAAAHAKARTILFGDFNSLPQDGLVRAAFSAYRDSFELAGTGFGYSFPRPLPWLRLDRVYTSRALVPVRHQTRCEPVSDHCGVVVDLRTTE
jgi:vancomycin resistance protein VanJ